MATWFWKPAAGLKADMHDVKISELTARVTELEGKEDPISIASLRMHRRLLAMLMNERDILATNIGKKK